MRRSDRTGAARSEPVPRLASGTGPAIAILAVTSAAAGLLPRAARADGVSFEEDFDGLAGSLRSAVDEAIPPTILGWTHDPPPGWSIDNSRMPPVQGVREWQGWSFTTMAFWTRAAAQGRGNFTLAEGILAVADPDEWNDKGNPAASGRFDSVLISPPIPVPAGRTTYLRFHSHYRQEDDQKAEVRVSFDGGPDRVLLHYDSSPSSDNGGSDAENREIVLAIPAPAEEASLVIKWALFDAGNNWYWAIDDIRVNEEPPEPPTPLPVPDVRDWPTYMHDNLRSGVTSEGLDLARMDERWTYTLAVAPRPAWPGPARWDAYARISNLKNMRNLDPVCHVTVAGDSLYFGSSGEDCARCLDALTGEERWVFFADGPVRLPPSYHDGRVYFGSDDGRVYCLDAATGSLVWTYAAAPRDIMVPCDGKLISQWPVRTGVLVQDGRAYFAASLLPWERSYLFAVDAATGSDTGEGRFKVSRGAPVTMQGALLASPTRLYVPQGRREPMVFRRADGAYLGTMTGGGGVFCLLTTDSHFVHGPGNKAGWLKESDAETCDILATIDGGNLMVVSEDVAYIQRGSALLAMRRADRRILWTIPCPYTRSLIKAGDLLVAGGDGEVAAFDPSSGERLWTQAVEGKAYGLAAAGGVLYVSTDAGRIHAFGPAPSPAGGQRPGDFNQDGRLEIGDAISILNYLFGGAPAPLPCEGGAEAGGANMTLLDANGDAALDIGDAIAILAYLFSGGPPPALGTACTPIPGCPDRCAP